MKLIIIPTQIEFKILFPNISYIHNALQELSTDVFVFVSGIGSTQSLLNLSNLVLKNTPIFNSPTEVLLVGIAGMNQSSQPQLEITEVVEVISETDGNTGAQAEHFLSAEDLEWVGSWSLKTNKNSCFKHIKKVKSLSVQSCSGTPSLAQNRLQKFNCSIENMEGLSVGLWAQQNQFKFSQIRAISNIVGDRNHQNWNINQALINLTPHINRWVDPTEGPEPEKPI
jgi:futalosine hydrolase